jgi:hypothetical protein
MKDVLKRILEERFAHTVVKQDPRAGRAALAACLIAVDRVDLKPGTEPDDLLYEFVAKL